MSKIQLSAYVNFRRRAREAMEFYHKVLGGKGVALSGMGKKRLTEIFNDLAEGGQIKMPLAKQPWGTDVGWLTDKFGINWMINLDKA